MDLIQLKIEKDDFLIESLYRAGAHISIYQNERPISIELLDNWLETLGEIRRDTERDSDRELEWENNLR